MRLVDQIAALRTRARIPATRVARAAGTDVSNIYAMEHGRRDPVASTLERVAAGAGSLLLAFPSGGAAFVADSVASLARDLDGRNIAGAYRQLIQISDDLAAADPVTGVLLSHIQPPRIDDGWDAAVAGVVEWRLGQKGAPTPAWLSGYGTGAGSRWEPFAVPYDVDTAAVPSPLRRRDVWIEETELSSV